MYMMNSYYLLLISSVVSLTNTIQLFGTKDMLLWQPFLDHQPSHFCTCILYIIYTSQVSSSYGDYRQNSHQITNLLSKMKRGMVSAELLNV
jgi:hypothetical protein